ncbi:MAG: aminotransferase class I/II-fold pyridoxal phosphate-dependent enzyme [Cyclobacteriaceae bacterium]
MKDKIWMSPPDIGDLELELVNEAFATNWVAPLGPLVDRFEEELANYCGTNDAAALTSGTASIHLALRLLNVEQGDYVICQSLTFSGTINPVMYEKAIPFFIDSEPNSWNMDPSLLEESIASLIAKGKKVAAIIPVHIYGMPADMTAIKAIASKYEIPVIEDAAEALGSEYKEERCGGLGDFGVLSFNGNKIITTSGGGALLSNNADMISKARYLAAQARRPELHYEHTEIGYNYRMSNVLSGIGIGQLASIDEKVRRRRKSFERYSNYFNNHEKGMTIGFQPESNHVKSNRWLTAVTIGDNSKYCNPKKLIEVLSEANIEARPIWKPMHLQPVFRDAPSLTNGLSQRLFEQGVCLPSGSGLEDEEFDRIFEALDAFYEKI